MAEREICCCGASGWAKVIAWFQIVLNALAVVTIVLGLIGLISLGAEGVANANAKTEMGQIMESLGESAYPILITIMVLSLVVVSIAIAMGIILLKGSKEKNTKYLRWWVIYAGVCMVWALISAVNSGNIAMILFRVLIVVLLYGFGIWVVRVHIEEIEKEKYSAPPAYVYEAEKGP